ncbi:hypothetical protein C8A03DRAFT_40920 [Achaetomium macrosporum]|uniref:Uncharacterized protein n=1 Tax=Achaetomium macrosporum TaxID=79813 RepID=A0AAN7HH15_9PEZI|nr:hypothetical protein C8A03DRAFT_40920 [Achaetomium macrosporum]
MLPPTATNALRAAGGRTWRPISMGAALRPRWLSTSPALRGGHVVTFGETSNPELAEILDTLRQKVFLPTYLAAEQRKKIHDRKLADVLRNDPVTMEIDGVVHKFRYIDRMTEIPNTRKALRRALECMKTPADFKNVPPLLEGCVRARRKVDPDILAKLIRRASMHDSIQVILDCIKEVRRTGFKLDTSEKINELLTWIQHPAIMSGFNKTKTQTALRQVQLILNILESDESHRPTKESEGRFPFYRDPQMLAARLHMAAAMAVYHQDGRDENGKVTKYAQELVTLWPENAGLLDLQPDESYKSKTKMHYMLDRNYFLWMASPVLNGLMLATQVVDPALMMQLQNRADAVEAEVRAALDSHKRKRGGRGENMYNTLFNPQANAEEAEEEA